MDPLGFGLETFDAIGRHRTTDQGIKIDGSGMLDGAAFGNAFEMGQRLREHPGTGKCLVRTLYRYATGHVDEADQAPLLSEFDARFRAGGNKVKGLLLDVVLSDAFRFAHGEKKPPAKAGH
jgi:hypothetical protein